MKMFGRFIAFVRALARRPHAGPWGATVSPPVASCASPTGGVGAAPGHRETRSYLFSEVQNGQVLGTVDSFERVGATLDVNHVQNGVVTANSTVVRPSRIAARCDVCGGFTELAVHCDRCSRCLCFKHIGVLDTPSGPFRLCGACLKATVSGWNTWSDKPGYRFPKSVTSITKTLPPGGPNHDDADGTTP